MFGLALFAIVASLLIVCDSPVSRPDARPKTGAAAVLLPRPKFRVFSSVPSRVEFPGLRLAEEFGFERALEAYEELIDATCAARRG